MRTTTFFVQLHTLLFFRSPDRPTNSIFLLLTITIIIIYYYFSFFYYYSYYCYCYYCYSYYSFRSPATVTFRSPDRPTKKRLAAVQYRKNVCFFQKIDESNSDSEMFERKNVYFFVRIQRYDE